MKLETFVILTDSISDLDLCLVKKLNLNIEIIKLKHCVDDVYFDDCIDENRSEKLNEFYNLIKTGKKIKTTQINSGEFNDFFRKFLEDGLNVLFISCSSNISGTYNSACIAAKELSKEFVGRKIIIVDSLAASLGQGMMAIEAAKKREQGMDIDEVTNFLESFKKKVCTIFILDDLNHLKEGGRISPSMAFFGGLLGIKPILKINDDGALSFVSKQRGKKKCFDYLIESIKNNSTNINSQTLYLSFNNTEKNDVLDFEKVLENNLKIKGIIKNEIGSCLTAHTGINVMAVFYLGNKR